jgi:hypothetical protein
MKYNHLLEQFEFRWHLELQTIPSDLHLQLFVEHLVLHKHFLKSWQPDKDCTSAISRKDFLVAKTSNRSINGSKDTVNWFL